MSKAVIRPCIALLSAAAGAWALSSLPAVAGDYTPPAVAGSQVVKYPVTSQRAGEEGVVFIQVYVSESGRVRTARLVRSSGVDRLDNAALESVLAWRFKPAQDSGRTVSGWANVQVSYKVPTGQ